MLDVGLPGNCWKCRPFYEFFESITCASYLMFSETRVFQKKHGSQINPMPYSLSDV